MKRIAILLILVLGGVGARASGQIEFKFKEADYNFLYRNSGILGNMYLQAGEQVSLHPKWINLGAGVEIDFTDSTLTRYYFEQSLKFTDRDSLVLRLNHFEHKDWEVGENFLNTYYQQNRSRLRWAAGVAWISPVLDDWQNPFKFDTDFDQVRFLYSVSYGWPFYKDKFDFRVGAQNFTQYENFGYDHLGPFAEIGYQLTNRSRIKAMADLRYTGIGTATMSLERQTYLIGLEWKNVPRRPASEGTRWLLKPKSKEEKKDQLKKDKDKKDKHKRDKENKN